MNFDEIRKRTIIALFSDDELIDQLVLKGGNALSLIHRVSSRSSLDLDFSLETDIKDLEGFRGRVFRALNDRFDSIGYRIFDETLKPRPPFLDEDERPWWGGYQLKFKLIERQRFEQLKGHPAKLQVNSLPVGPGQRRVFNVDFSKNEHTRGKQAVELDDYTIYVYTLEMLVIEKLRALCQQMDEYELRPHSTARARDFYDIHLVLTTTEIDLASKENMDLLKQIFGAKKVPVTLLGLLPQYRELHRPDWSSVEITVKDELQDYDYYFDFVVEQVRRLDALWVEEPPL